MLMVTGPPLSFATLLERDPLGRGTKVAFRAAAMDWVLASCFGLG